LNYQDINPKNNGIKTIGMNACIIPTLDTLQRQIKQLGATNNMADFIARIQVFRENGGLFEDSDTQYIITCSPLPLTQNTKGLSVCIYRNAVKSTDSLSNIKHCNYLPYLMAATYARQSGKDDALLLNMHNRICDSSIANVFCIKDDKIRTPALEEGCVAGVYREWLIKILREKKFSIDETCITESELLDSDEIFLTNAIRGIMPVSSINEIFLQQSITEKIKSATEDDMEA
jgi:branched-chain amino acid aminotransferase